MNAKNKILLIGGDSKLGAVVKEKLKLEFKVIQSTTRRSNKSDFYLDLNKLSKSNINFNDFNTLIFFAAVTKFEDCSRNYIYSRNVNVISPYKISKQISSSNSKIIYISSSAVFDSSKPIININKKPNPSSDYGKLKAEAEKVLTEINGKTMILRISKIITNKDHLFVNWLKDLKNGKKIYPFSDLYFCPISTDYFYQVLSFLINHNEYGNYQFSGTKDISYYEAMVFLAKKFNLDNKLIFENSYKNSEISKNDVLRYTSMDCSKITKLCGILPPEPYEVLSQVFAN